MVEGIFLVWGMSNFLASEGGAIPPSSGRENLVRWHAAASVLARSSFYRDTGKPKGLGFLETFKNLIHSKIILVTPGIIRSLKLKNKKKTFSFIGREKIMSSHHKIVCLASLPAHLNYLFQPLFYL